MVSRRGFVILEAIIAAALVSLAIIPISSYPYKAYTKEVQKLQALELERLSELAFAEFVKMLPALFSWEELSGDPLTYELSPAEVNLGSLGTFHYKASVEVSIAKECKNCRLLECVVKLTSEPQNKTAQKLTTYFLAVIA
jgi:hypothetical protein